MDRRVPCVGSGIPQDAQHLVHEHVWLWQTFLGCAKTREVTGPNQQTCADALDMDVSASECRAKGFFATHSIDEQLAENRVPVHALDESPSTNFGVGMEVIVDGGHVVRRFTFVRDRIIGILN
ncbi:hypothetical protein BGV71_32155 [Burkholderia ubonensis]|nr:hypothetical protein BGV71_32155 [Burkholderia ubonensis]